jgi:cbb3-type cytochrome oxidase subunit 1
VHGHVHLLGWVTLALTGAVYAVSPDMAKSALARWHVILHNLGLPIMLAALTAYLSGVAAAEPGIAVGAILSTLGLGAFTLAIWRAL